MPDAGTLVRNRPQIAFIQVDESAVTLEVWIGGEGGIRSRRTCSLNDLRRIGTARIRQNL